MRTGGAEALAFDVACLAGPEAALPHGAPGDRPVIDGSVLLFDFGAQVAGYRSDMTRTLFVGEPSERDLDDLRARGAGPGGGHRGASRPRSRSPPDGDLPSGRAIDGDRPRRHRRPPATASISATGPVTASASPPTRRRRSGGSPPRRPLPSPTVFSVEPGIYLEGEMGVRIEDLVLLDAAGGSGRAPDPVPARGPRRRGLTTRIGAG